MSSEDQVKARIKAVIKKTSNWLRKTDFVFDERDIKGFAVAVVLSREFDSKLPLELLSGTARLLYTVAKESDDNILQRILNRASPNRPMGARDKIIICIKRLDGTERWVEVSVKTTILELKQMLEAQLHLPTDQQRLIFCGKTLHNNSTIEECRIYDRTTIHLMSILRGC